jgi:hypothetical protein
MAGGNYERTVTPYTASRIHLERHLHISLRRIVYVPEGYQEAFLQGVLIGI